MARKKFSPEEIRKLSKNKHVSRCGLDTVRYTREFRELAVRQHAEGISAVDIFKNAGIDLEAIGKRAPNRLMHQWRSSLKVPGSEEPLPKHSRGELEKLRAEVAYLKEENRFLARIRAKGKKSA